MLEYFTKCFLGGVGDDSFNYQGASIEYEATKNLDGTFTIENRPSYDEDTVDQVFRWYF